MKTKVKTKSKPRTFLSQTEKQIRESARRCFEVSLQFAEYERIFTDEMRKQRHRHYVNEYERRIKELNR